MTTEPSDLILRTFARDSMYQGGGAEPPPCPRCGSEAVAAVASMAMGVAVLICLSCRNTQWSDDIGDGFEFAHPLRDKYRARAATHPPKVA